MNVTLTTVLFLVLGCSVCAGQSDGEIQEAAEAIWEADQYRFPDSDAVVDLDGPKLFAYVNEGRMGGTPIYQYLRNLFPYYNPVLGTADVCDSDCVIAQTRFIDEMYNRAGRPMQVAQDYLVSFGLAPSDVDTFKDLLHQFWFQPYSRAGTVLDSSGFEHTFLGELYEDGGDVLGFYNWVVTYYEEKAERFQYGASLDECYPFNLLLEFEWQEANKTDSAMFIRTSPEVEMALYTLCFLTRPNQDCNLTLEGVPNTLRVETKLDVLPLTVGAAYPLCNGSISTGGPPGQEDLDDVTQRIWAADIYRFQDDQAIVNEHGPILFQYVNESLLSQPPYAAFLPLLDNYDPYTGVPEVCGQPCWEEEEAFLDEILSDPDSPMRIAHDFLAEYDLASADLDEFKLELREWWFQLYSRSGGAALDSSGFEHVFLGEIRSGSDVLGLHNWVYVYFEEKEGNFQYGSLQDECEPFQLKFSHDWLEHHKPINSLWIRASPDVELAIFTVCFQVRQTSICEVMLDGIRNRVTTYDYSGHTPRTVGTAYPTC